MSKLYYTGMELKIFITDGEDKYRILENFNGMSINVWVKNSPSYNSYWAEIENKIVLNKIRRWYLKNRENLLTHGEIRK